MEEYSTEFLKAMELAGKDGHWLKTKRGGKYHPPSLKGDSTDSVCGSASYADFKERSVLSIPRSHLEDNICQSCLDLLSMETDGQSNTDKFGKGPEDLIDGGSDGS